VAIALAISVTAMIGLTARAVIARASCANEPVLVNLAVSYDIAPAIQEIARTFNTQSESADGRCVQVEVTQGEPSAVAAQIDGQDSLPGTTAVDAWIPDSSLWVDVARSYATGAQAVQQTGINVARSPIMIVTSQAVAKATDVFGSPASWNLLLAPNYGGPPSSMGLSVDMPDPSDSAVGLSTLIEVNRDLGPSQAGRTAFTKFVFSAASTEEFNSATALQSFVASTGAPFYRKAIAVTSEQAVISYDRANPSQPLAARYPAAASKALGSPELDYPYVLTSSDPLMTQAADAFGKYLEGSYAQSVIRYNGFRSLTGVPDQMPASSGLSPQPLGLATPPSPSEAATNLSSWQKLGLGSRDLTLIDDSGAMAVPAGLGSLTLEQVLTQTGSKGLALFPDTTQMGLWEVPDSTDASKSYRSLVPIGPLPADWGVISRREQLQQIIATLTPSSKPLRLHDAILAAYQQMTSSYAPNYSNAVLVLTAGVDGSGDMRLSSLVSKLHTLYNPNRKIEIVIIQFGQQGSFSALREIADATGGVAYRIDNPAEVGQIFIEAIAHRMCDQGCTAP
jgi:Ca-activated chloride channel homolog